MREKIIGNIILKLGSRMQKEDLDYIEIIPVSYTHLEEVCHIGESEVLKYGNTS